MIQKSIFPHGWLYVEEINQKIADQIIDEANQAFTYNMRMFKELEGNLIAVLGKIVFNYITKKVRKGSTETS